MHTEGARNFANTLREIGRNSLCHNLLSRIYSLKPFALYTGDPLSPQTPKFFPTSNLGLSSDFLLGEKSPQL